MTVLLGDFAALTEATPLRRIACRTARPGCVEQQLLANRHIGTDDAKPKSMTRGHSNRVLAVRQEQRADRLQVRADRLGRRSARSLGVVVSLAYMAELRHTIASGTLPDTIRKLDSIGRSTETYAIDFAGRELIAVYDRRAQSIAAFLPYDGIKDEGFVGPGGTISS